MLGVTVDGAANVAFCTDAHNPIIRGRCYGDTTKGVSTALVACALQYYPATSTLSNVEAAARQSAVWHFSDDFTLVNTTPTTAEVYARYGEIVADVEAKYSAGECAAVLTPTIAIDPPAAVDYLAADGLGGRVAVARDYTLKLSRGGLPIAGQMPPGGATSGGAYLGTLSAGGVSSNPITVTTGPDGTAVVTLTHDGLGTATLTAEATFPGTMVAVQYDPGPTVQKVVIPASEDLTVSGTAQEDWVEGASLVVKKFHDLNGNGLPDSGEPLLNWQVRWREVGGTWHTMWLDSTDAIYGSTAGDGTAVIGADPTKLYEVEELSCAGWLATTPPLVADVAPGSTVWFGNLELPAVIVTKFEDLNGNGRQDAGEPSLDGWGFRVDSENGAGAWEQNYSGVTAAGGLLSFAGISYDTYRVSEIGVDGWYASTPATQEVVVAEPTVYRLSFGNLRPSMLQVDKDWFVDGSEVAAPATPATVCVRRTDSGSPPIALEVTAGSGGAVIAPTTIGGTAGYYCQSVTDVATWANLWPGTYEASEPSAPAGSTGAAPVTVPVSSGLVAPAEAAVVLQNSAVTGALEVTKTVAWGKATPEVGRFEICVTGPSFPGGDCQTVGTDGGILAWSGLLPGSYTISETDPGPHWTVEVSGSPANVPSGGKATADVLNTHKEPEVPTAVTVSAWDLTAGSDSVLNAWTTIYEVGTTSFRLYRGQSADRAAAVVVAELPAYGATGGAYSFTDGGLGSGVYYYWLVEVLGSGPEGEVLGPKQAVVGVSPQAGSQRVLIPLVIMN